MSYTVTPFAPFQIYSIITIIIIPCAALGNFCFVALCWCWPTCACSPSFFVGFLISVTINQERKKNSKNEICCAKKDFFLIRRGRSTRSFHSLPRQWIGKTVFNDSIVWIKQCHFFVLFLTGFLLLRAGGSTRFIACSYQDNAKWIYLIWFNA